MEKPEVSGLYLMPGFTRMKRVLLLAVILVIHYFVPAGSRAQIRVIKSDGSGVIFEYTPGDLRIISSTQGGKRYRIPVFDDCGFEPMTGYPQIPVRSVLVALPPGASAEVSAQEAASTTVKDFTVLPFPGFDRTYNENEDIYNSGKLYPEANIRIESTGYMREIRVVRLLLYPARWNPQSKELAYCSQMMVEVRFVKMEREITENPKAVYDPDMENVVVNYGSAYKWAYPVIQKPSLKKTINAAGTWLKLYVQEEGIYKLDNKYFSSHGFDFGDIDPHYIRMFNNGGRELSHDVNSKRITGLNEIAIYVSGEEDGRFNDSDYILFYGRGVNGWEIDETTSEKTYYRNHYTDKNVYWLTVDYQQKGRRMAIVQPPSGDADLVPEHYRFRFHEEQDVHNLFHSGLEWYGKLFIGQDEAGMFFNVDDGVLSEPVDFTFRFKGGSGGYNESHYFNILINNQLLGSTGHFYAYNRKQVNFSNPDVAIEGKNGLTIQYSGSSTSTQAYLDWYEIEYPRQFKARDNVIIFESPENFSGVAGYVISEFTKDDVRTFDITRYDCVRILPAVSSGNGSVTIKDRIEHNELKRYVSLDLSAAAQPESIEEDINSDLHSETNSADFIVISHGDFIEELFPLKELREQPGDDFLETRLVNITDVFDEFSGGLVDPAAIRYFLKYAYENWQKKPRYVLLFGDGDYDYRNVLNTGDKNWIPPYEIESSDPITTRTTDDWFTYISGDDRIMDLSIGRIPVQKREEARYVVEKIVEYAEKQNPGIWRNVITFIADDEFSDYDDNESIHTYDTEDLEENFTPPEFNRKKIYLMEYEGVSNPSFSGIDKPGAAADLIGQINEGTILVNFIGHGAPNQLANERVFYYERDFTRIENEGNYPLWVSATCDFAFFDNPEFQSAAEELVISEKKGAIGVVSSSRLAYAIPNAVFNKAFFKNLFRNSNKSLRMGDAIRYAKQQTGSTVNSEKYVLLGDPTMRLGIPELKLLINHFQPDSFKALGKNTLRGELYDTLNLKQFNDGRVFIQVFDTERRSSHRMPNGNTVSYRLPGKGIFRGTSTLTSGDFESTFIIPKDITYGGDNGRISLYFWEEKTGRIVDGNGYLEGIYVGGTNAAGEDNTGPFIEIVLKNRSFSDDGFVPPNPQFVIRISDDSGINLTGEIGHAITVMRDDDIRTVENLSGKFVYDENSYTDGSIEYRPQELELGRHTMTVKAWDNFNNSSEEKVDFEVIRENVLSIREVFNFPNPFSDETVFTFRISEASEVTIKIFTANGRLIQEIVGNIAENGYNTIDWNGLDRDGTKPANGVYFYKIIARSLESTLRGEATGKLVIMR